jgi:ribonuclease J
MLCEGTRINSNDDKTEETIESEGKKVVSNFKGLVVVNFPVRDLDRNDKFP